MTINSVPATIVGGLIKPTKPLHLTEGMEIKIDIHFPPRLSDEERAVKVQRLADALSRAEFRSDVKFRREDLYDRD